MDLQNWKTLDRLQGDYLKSNASKYLPLFIEFVDQYPVPVSDDLAFFSKSPPISSCPKDVVIPWLTAVVIKEVSAHWNCENTISPQQAALFSEELIDLYPSIKICEIKKVFKDARHGLFGRDGKTFGRIDNEVLFIWFRLYFERSRMTFAARWEEMNSIKNEETAPVLISEEDRSMIQRDWERIEAKVRSKTAKKVITDGERQRQQEKMFRRTKEQLAKAYILVWMSDLFLNPITNKQHDNNK